MSEKETVANWMMAHGFSTGHGDTVANMLIELAWQIDERVARAIDAEQDACARVSAIALLGADKSLSDRVLNAIRSRGQSE